jgi:hypothetical protein
MSRLVFSNSQGGGPVLTKTWTALHAELPNDAIWKLYRLSYGPVGDQISAAELRRQGRMLAKELRCLT